MVGLNLSRTLAVLRRLRAGSPRLRTLAREQRGQALVEFAVILPILLVLSMGIIVFAIAFWNQLTLTHATSTAANVAAYTRTNAATVDVCNPVNAALYNAGTGINNPNAPIPLTFSIATGPANSTATPTPVVTNVAVKQAGVSACNTALTLGGTVQVSTSYGCNLNFFGFKLASACKLTATTSEAIQ
jgi:Flp pilus assembly protein TadG